MMTPYSLHAKTLITIPCAYCTIVNTEQWIVLPGERVPDMALPEGWVGLHRGDVACPRHDVTIQIDAEIVYRRPRTEES